MILETFKLNAKDKKYDICYECLIKMIQHDLENEVYKSKYDLMKFYANLLISTNSFKGIKKHYLKNKLNKKYKKGGFAHKD